MSELPADLRRHRPYEHLSDGELDLLVSEAVDLRFRIAMLDPAQVAATMIAHGCPAESAYQQVILPGLRMFAARFHIDVEDATKGDSEAKRRVEYVETGWANMRRTQAQVSRETREKEQSI